MQWNFIYIACNEKLQESQEGLLLGYCYCPYFILGLVWLHHLSNVFALLKGKRKDNKVGCDWLGLK